MDPNQHHQHLPEKFWRFQLNFFMRGSGKSREDLGDCGDLWDQIVAAGPAAVCLQKGAQIRPVTPEL